MYLQHFGLQEFPFSLTPDTQFFTKLPSHQEAVNVVLVGLQNGEGFIKITGEVGTGKTMICRQLLTLLDKNNFKTVYVPNPELTPKQLHQAIAQELGVDADIDTDERSLLIAISEKLIAFHQTGKRVVILIDEMQAMPETTMETLRLMTNLETEKSKLIQVVLFGQPELDKILNKYSMRQFKQRIVFSHKIKPLSMQCLDFYLTHRMHVAGYQGISPFKKSAVKKLAKASAGIPRLVNILCHKALMVAYGKGEPLIKPGHVKQAIVDTDSASIGYKLVRKLMWSIAIFFASVLSLSIIIGV